MNRESFKSRLGFLLVSAGCAIGIGNVWRFPYVAGENGGGLFVLLYLVFLILMGLFHFGNLIRFIPYTITTGFTSGIAVTIFIGQIKDFLGLTIVSEEPLIETMDKLKAVFQFISTTNLQALLVGVISL